MGWDIDPEGLYKQIRTVGARYGKPMMITENGIATTDDKQRVEYIQEHLAAIAKAKKDGSDIRGYFHWSLADNYEWHFGYTAKFGLSTMDPKTKERILKPSALYYRDIIREHR
jgi:beta-glucosidase/6-phospho-beta-glucosidase/beta-galactosidase